MARESDDENRAPALGLVKLSAADFARLYQSHQKLVRSVAFRMVGPDDLDEIVQQAFVKVWKGQPSFREESKITSWIYRVTVNVALDFVRAKQRRLEVSDDLKSAQAVTFSSADGSFDHRDLVQKGLMTLSEDHRSVLVLSYLEELSIVEVAEVLEINEGTVKSRLHYAKAAFRDYLVKNGVEL